MASPSTSFQKSHVVVGQFSGPHGVRGEFKLRSFTELPENITAYGPLWTDKGQVLTAQLGREVKPAMFIATAPEINTREDCDAFKGALLYVPRDALPAADEDEFYLDDLVGLKAETPDGDPAGQVKAVVNYGAGDLIEISQRPDRKGAVLIPFTKEDVPTVSLAEGRIVVVLPPEDDKDASMPNEPDTSS